jgi:hypothetical protein
MINGDLSNDTPPRIIVLSDVVCDVLIDETGRFIKRSTRKIKFKKVELSQLWNLSFKYGLSVELAAFADEGWTQIELDTLMEKLDNRGGNPFNYANLYEDCEEIVEELPYRANLKGIVDIRDRVARYGSWGIELDNL